MKKARHEKTSSKRTLDMNDKDVIPFPWGLCTNDEEHVSNQMGIVAPAGGMERYKKDRRG